MIFVTKYSRIDTGICEKQPLSLQIFSRLSYTNLIRPILEYLFPFKGVSSLYLLLKNLRRNKYVEIVQI